jgi:hypothetical protein
VAGCFVQELLQDCTESHFMTLMEPNGFISTILQATYPIRDGSELF